MDISLTRDEYEQLRPSPLALEFIDDLKTIFGTPDPDASATLTQIKDRLARYNSDSRRAGLDNNFRLWPTETIAGTVTKEALTPKPMD